MAGEQLRVIEGRESGKPLSVDAGLLIGRVGPRGRGTGSAAIPRSRAATPTLSRGADGRLTIEDLGSANGTFVNDERIDAPRVLDLGDVVRVGKTVLQVTDASRAQRRSRPAEPDRRLAGSEPAARRPEVLVVTAGTALGRRLAARRTSSSSGGR